MPLDHGAMIGDLEAPTGIEPALPLIVVTGRSGTKQLYCVWSDNLTLLPPAASANWATSARLC
jgi:hypothetical protein